LSGYTIYLLAESDTTASAVHEVIPGLLQLYNEVVVLPPNETPEEITGEPKRDALQDCIGAIDGTHLPVSIRGGEDRQAAWRGKEKRLTQNVFAAVDFKLNFVYALAGWEGTAHDQRVFNAAINQQEHPFKVPAGRYYVADAGYANTKTTLTPYREVRYHLKEQERRQLRPADEKELFNL
jgi:hypothetical protein